MIKNPSHPKKSVRKVKQCKFTQAGLEYIDYKDVETLQRFTNDQGKILPDELLVHQQNIKDSLQEQSKEHVFLL